MKKNGNKKKIILSIMSILIIIGSITIGCSFMKEEKEPIPTNTVEVLESINEYGYHLEDRDTEIYKEKFTELKKILEEEEIDYEQYAKTLAQLFLIDLYTIDNKLSKYDVGSLDFIYETEQEKFRNKLTDSMYKLVEDNSNNTRKQELPVVSNVEVEDMKEIKYKKGNESLEGYEIKATISYEKDLKYDKNVVVTIVKEENKLYVVNLSPED